MAARSRARSAGGDGQSLRQALQEFVGTFVRRLSAVESLVSRLERDAGGGARATAKRSTAKRSTAKRATAKRSTAKRGTAKRATAGTRGSATKATTAKRGSAKKATTAKRGSAKKATTAKRAGSSRRKAPGTAEATSAARTTRGRSASGRGGGGAARPAASRSRVGSRTGLPDAGAGASTPMSEADLSQRREQLVSELGPPPSPFSDLGPAPAGDGDEELASEELSVAVQPDAPGSLF